MHCVGEKREQKEENGMLENIMHNGDDHCRSPATSSAVNNKRHRSLACAYRHKMNLAILH